MKELRGRKALVTGAASGIGRAIALALAREKIDLYLLDINEAGLAAVAAEASAMGVEAIPAPSDLMDRSRITAVLAEMRRRWGKLDILVNNAGVVYYGPIDKMTQAQWDWVTGVNLLAPIQITHELLPLLLEQPQSHILNVCSVAGLVAGGRLAAYSTTKFGLIGFSEALRLDLGPRGVGVTALCPGFVKTNLLTSGQSGRPDGTIPEPPAWLCTSDIRVGYAAVKAIRRNKRLVVLSPLGHVAVNVKRFAPWLGDLLTRISLLKHRLNGKDARSRQSGSQGS